MKDVNYVNSLAVSFCLLRCVHGRFNFISVDEQRDGRNEFQTLATSSRYNARIGNSVAWLLVGFGELSELSHQNCRLVSLPRPKPRTRRIRGKREMRDKYRGGSG